MRRSSCLAFVSLVLLVAQLLGPAAVCAAWCCADKSQTDARCCGGTMAADMCPLHAEPKASGDARRASPARCEPTGCGRERAALAAALGPPALTATSTPVAPSEAKRQPINLTESVPVERPGAPPVPPPRPAA